jgi:hypothetical protein
MADFGFVTIDAAKDNFFDRAVVASAAEHGRRGALSGMAAFVRKVARNSMRRTKNYKDHAEPGQPPNAHAGQLKEMLYFAYDSDSRTAVIGPVKMGDGTVPGLLEFGGDVTRRGKVFHYPAHPYMGPALEKSEDKFPSHWADSVRAS